MRLIKAEINAIKSTYITFDSFKFLVSIRNLKFLSGVLHWLEGPWSVTTKPACCTARTSKDIVLHMSSTSLGVISLTVLSQ